MYDLLHLYDVHHNCLICTVWLMKWLALQAHIQSGKGELRKGLKTVLALLHTAKLPVTRRMRALLVEGSLLEDDLQAYPLTHACAS